MAITSTLGDTGQTLVVKISGRFDLSSYNAFHQTYKTGLSGVQRVQIDLAETCYLDSAALGMLLMLREATAGQEAGIEIVNCRPEVKEILDTANFDKLFQIS